MKWVTRENADVDRIACPWLIRRFIDPDAEFLFVARDQVLAVAEREGGTPTTPKAPSTPTGMGSARSSCSSRTSSSPTIPASSVSLRSCTPRTYPRTEGLLRRAPVCTRSPTGSRCCTAPRITRRSSSRHRCTTRCTPGVRIRPLEHQLESEGSRGGGTFSVVSPCRGPASPQGRLLSRSSPFLSRADRRRFRAATRSRGAAPTSCAARHVGSRPRP